MKKIFNLKQNGFTLVEMLGVIIILAFLSFLVSETIINNVKNTNKKLEVVATDLIISSAREYVELNPNLFPKVLNKSYYISFEILKQNNLIREDMLPKIDSINELKSKFVLVEYNGNNYIYNLVEEKSIAVKIDPNGGTYNGSSDIYSFDEIVNSTITVSTPKKSGYIFDKWIADIEDVVINENNITLTSQSVTLTAQWIDGIFDYAYSGNYEEFVVPKTGYYKIETWGAQGQSVGDFIGGKGAYSSGTIYLEKNEKLYVYVGEVGKVQSTIYNGGGILTIDGYGGYGGGATDIRYFGSTEITDNDLLWNSELGLNSRIMVAAGGGGTGNRGSGYGDGNGGSGGELMGLTGEYTNVTKDYGVYPGTGGSQTNGGISLAINDTANVGEGLITPYIGTFGIGGGYQVAGGGGYYGGGGNGHAGGGGGSSFISGYKGSVAITSSTDRTPKTGCTDGTTDIACSYHYSGKIFEATEMKAGNESMPTQDGTNTMTGNSGNGYAKIEYIGELFQVDVETKENFASTDITINIISSSELSIENKYQYYISTSNTELVGGSWQEYTPGETFKIYSKTGRYYLWLYSISNINGNIIDDNTNTNTPYVKKEIVIASTVEYAYSGSYEKFVAPITGNYKINLWGAQGGVSGASTGGKGAYTSGTLYLEKDEAIYIYIGGSTTNRTGGYNGGGTGSNPAEGSYIGYGGGGATDIRYFGDTEISDSDLVWNSTLGLNSRIMVAAGGGGGAQWVSLKGAPAGGLNGNSVYTTTSCDYGVGGVKISGATQTSGYSFGIGRNAGGASSVDCGVEGRGGGGAGYYGGSAQTSSGIETNAAGASGSSYISGYTGCVAITSSTSRTAKSGCANGTTDITCSYHYSGKVFESTEMKAGNEEMPTQDGTSTMTGNGGNGYAKIEFVSEIVELEVDTKENIANTAITININSFNELSSENKYQYYISTSNTELVGGSWQEYTPGETFTVLEDNGRYYLWVYPISDIIGNITDNKSDSQTPYVKKEIIITNTLEYAYSGNYEEVIIQKNGYYKLEAWGAQGGAYSTYVPGNGAYTSGYVYLEKNELIYVTVGGKGSASAASSTYVAGGYNGGGSANYAAGTGGGATDFRYESNTLNDRIMVAAGGGGTGRLSSNITGGHGGSLIGIVGGNYNTSSVNGGHGGTQIAGGALGADASATKGTVGSFGQGGQGGYNSTNSHGAGAGGGGYYGGAGGSGRTGGGGGGSSYISGYDGAIAITSSTDTTPKCDSFTDETCSYHYSGKIFVNGVMYDGSETMPTQDGTSTMTGNSGDGFARIAYIGKTLPEIDESTKEFTYQNGRVHIYTVPKSGYYKLEAWGAQGGAYDTYIPGNGAYTSGYVYLEKDEMIYVTVGGKGSASAASSTYTAGGYNGGGSANYAAGTGGGATDFRYESNTLNDRIMVAAGGGGTGRYSSAITGGHGGALIGIDGGHYNTSNLNGGGGGTQTSGGAATTATTAGTSGSLGIGGNGGYNSTNSHGAGAGGGGYYGGAGGSGRTGGGGGGSSYISGYVGATAITSSTDTTPKCETIVEKSCSYHYSGKIFTNGIMYDGRESMPTYDGTSTMIGNAGNGHAKITYIGTTLSEIVSEEITLKNGTIVYYDVLNGSLCINYHVDNSITGYNGLEATKTTTNQTSCLKFYAFNDYTGNQKANLLLDHNTTAKTYWTSSSSNKNGPVEAKEQLYEDTSGWIGTETPDNYALSQTTGGDYTIYYDSDGTENDYKARFITAQEVAVITGADKKDGLKFNESTTGEVSGILFDSLTENAESGGYGWLYDRTSTSCKTYGCLNFATGSSLGEMDGYWTATSYFGLTTHAWVVYSEGGIGRSKVNVNTYSGIRPVIEVLKSNIY